MSQELYGQDDGRLTEVMNDGVPDQDSSPVGQPEAAEDGNYRKFGVQSIPGNGHTADDMHAVQGAVQGAVQNTFIPDTMRDPELVLKQFCLDYLRRNVEVVRSFQAIKELMDRMDNRLPYVVITKCIDGRCHGTRSKGLPSLLERVLMRRTEGNNVNLSPANYAFWDAAGTHVSLSEQDDPNRPAIFMALAHTSKLNHGCAAHNEDNDAALKTVQKQSDTVAARFKNKVFAFYGMTNTDDLAHTFIFNDGHKIDVAELIDELKLTASKDVFHTDFLSRPIPDGMLQHYCGQEPAQKLFEGARPAFYKDLQKSVAAQVFILEKIDEAVLAGENKILTPALFDLLEQKLNAIAGIPPSLKSGLMYMIASNVAYSLYKRWRFARMDEAEKIEYLGHSEQLICYGEGFQTLGRNQALLVKPGRGNDTVALQTAKAVLDGVRTKYTQAFPPLVHVNIEIDDDELTPARFAGVEAKLKNRAHLIRAVFDDEPVAIITTYSKSHEKMFYPVQLNDANGYTVKTGFNVGGNLRPTDTGRTIALQELTYVQAIGS